MSSKNDIWIYDGCDQCEAYRSLDYGSDRDKIITIWRDLHLLRGKGGLIKVEFDGLSQQKVKFKPYIFETVFLPSNN